MAQNRAYKKNMLLLSNTTNAGGKPLGHAHDAIKAFLGSRRDIVFIPYANPGGRGYQQYYQALLPVLADFSCTISLIGEFENPRESIQRAQAIFVGGGNTWELLRQLKEHGLMYSIRDAVNRGVPYIGSSAGSVVAGLTIGNTNDMPAAESYGRDALALVPFNLNCHYQDAVRVAPAQKAAVLEIAPELKIILDHQGETRDERLLEYHALGNLETIVALREGAILDVEGDNIFLSGNGAKIFRPGKEVVEYKPGNRLDVVFE